MASEGRLVRSAAALFMAGGLLTLLTAWLPASGVRSGDTVGAVGLASVLAGGVVWLLPWERWPRPASLAVVPLALGLVAVADGGGARSPFTYGVYFVTVFAWVGLCQPPRTSLWLAPAAAPFYLLPALLRGSGLEASLASMVITVTVGVMIGETVAWAMDHARCARQEAEHRARLLHAVLRATGSVQALDAEEVLGDLATGAAGLGLDWVGVAVFSAAGTSWKLLACRSARGAPVAHELVGPHPSSFGPPGLVRAAGKPVLVKDFPASEAASGAFARLGLRSLAAAPVRVGGVQAAVLMGGSVQRALAEADLEALTILAQHAGSSLENAGRFGAERRARQQLAHISVRDELTGVGNRRHASALLESLEPGDALVMIDLDHFKSINDREGHQAGDAVLRELADHLRQGVRDADVVARYGGEEFLVVLRGVGPGGARTAERLCSTWRRAGRPTTFSAGVAVHRPGAAASDTLSAADAALYAAKRAGRDRVCQELAEIA